MMAYLLYFFLISCGISLFSCVHGWTYHHSSYTMTYNDAQDYCRKDYTDMVAIQNRKENDYLNDILNFTQTYYWIGIRKNNITGQWFWVGTKKVLTDEAKNWATNEPNNKSQKKNEDCVEMYVKRKTDAGKWNDEPCNKKKVALCYKASCHASSCNNHGECVETINDYTCNCSEGFYGANCEHVVTCPAVNDIDNGSVVCTHVNGDFTYQSSCHFACLDGHVLVGSESAQCTGKGDWGFQIPHCKAIRCEHPSELENGVIDCSNTGEMLPDKSTCSFSCNEGFTLAGSPSVICVTPGQWTEEFPKCDAIQCEHPEKPNNGAMNCSSNGEMLTHKSTCNFSCDEGYAMVGSPSTLCSTSGHWTEKSPICKAIKCKRPEEPLNGTMSCASSGDMLVHRSICNFNCAEGFRLIGSSSILCAAPGQWTGEIPKCEAVQCASLVTPENGVMECQDGSRYNATCAFSCGEGFEMVGSCKLQCLLSGEWTSSVPICQAIQCAAVIAPENGQMECQDASNYNSQCSFSCLEGFRLIGSSVVTCLSSGKWNAAVPKCEAVQCASLVTPENGVMDCQDGSRYNAMCTFSCGEGFEMVGSSKLQCLLSGEWTSSVPKCQAIQCAAVIAPENGQMECQDASNYNSQCSFSCSEGYRLIGSSVVTCLSSGKWNVAVPKCEVMKCDVLVAPFMGKINCTHPVGEFEYRSVCTIDCEYGLLLNGTNTIKCNSNGNWTAALPFCQVVKMTHESATYVTVGVVTTGASVLSAVSLLIWLVKRLRKTANKFTPSSYQHLEATGVYQNTEDSSGSV
ncbi:E-selectin-like isoform X2 [Pseudophryne corroboree]|uniref:E-selectin-like isoform X2 n=1 Tax=Pseudophryne corroboree TaxID=495146 RepID=UPI0030821AB6